MHAESDEFSILWNHRSMHRDNPLWKNGKRQFNADAFADRRGSSRVEITTVVAHVADVSRMPSGFANPEHEHRHRLDHPAPLAAISPSILWHAPNPISNHRYLTQAESIIAILNSELAQF